jgi:hypothetical protein
VSASRGPTMRLHFVMVGELLAVSRTARGISLQVRLDRLELVHGKPVRLLGQRRRQRGMSRSCTPSSPSTAQRWRPTKMAAVPNIRGSPAEWPRRLRYVSAGGARAHGSHQGHDGQIRRAEGSGGAGGPPADLPRSTEFELKVYSQQFCRAYYALQKLAGNPIADEALRDCQRLRKTWETRRRKQLERAGKGTDQAGGVL